LGNYLLALLLFLNIDQFVLLLGVNLIILLALLLEIDLMELLLCLLNLNLVFILFIDYLPHFVSLP